jgi:hypothetical protein
MQGASVAGLAPAQLLPAPAIAPHTTAVTDAVDAGLRGRPDPDAVRRLLVESPGGTPAGSL